MLLALTDHLRCTETHAETWLVARADAAEAGRMVEGVLGCPICQTERSVAGGVAYWTLDAQRAAQTRVPRPASPDAHPDRVIRIGALLAFGDSHMPFILCGSEANVAAGLGGLSDTPLVLIDPPDDRAALLASIIRDVPGVPFAAASIRGIVVDHQHAGEAFIATCVRALAPGGRLVAPVATPLPGGVKELARDAEQWVAEREVMPVTVPLTRATN